MVFVPWEQYGICKRHALPRATCKNRDCPLRHPSEEELRWLWDAHDESKGVWREEEHSRRDQWPGALRKGTVPIDGSGTDSREAFLPPLVAAPDPRREVSSAREVGRCHDSREAPRAHETCRTVAFGHQRKACAALCTQRDFLHQHHHHHLKLRRAESTAIARGRHFRKWTSSLTQRSPRTSSSTDPRSTALSGESRCAFAEAPKDTCPQTALAQHCRRPSNLSYTSS